MLSRPLALSVVPLVLLALLLPEPRPRDAQEAPKAPDPARVQEAVQDLQAAFKTGQDGVIIASIQRHASVASPEVVASIARGIDHAKVGVRRTAVEALRESELEPARLALESAWKKSSRVKSDLDLRERVLKAIAHHADPRSIELLADFPAPTVELPEPEPSEIVRARIRGLGRIRDARALSALMGAFTGFAEDRQRDLLPEFRLSLLVLTGVDHGQSLTAWLRWWEENRSEPVVAKEAPVLPYADREEWCGYWGLPLLSDDDEAPNPRRGG